MLTTAIISFREFLEAFLIIGVFLGISRKPHLKKEFEIKKMTKTQKEALVKKMKNT